ncbi:MAG: hypothetical protein JXB05_10270 [Myxococcaceae bacterium]|nr:hypothetical protein [Myxococcaceae bacterium]
MLQDLKALLQELQTLTQASQAGQLTPLQLETEVKKATGKLQEKLTGLTTQLNSGDSPESAYLVELFQAQIRMVLEQTGLKAPPIVEEEESEKLIEDLELRKRGPVRT